MSSLSRITTKIVCYSLTWTSTVHRRTHRGLQVNSSERLPTQVYGNIAFLLFKYGSESYTGAKVKGHESCLWSERFTGAKVPRNQSSWNIRSRGAKVPGVRKFHGTKVLGHFAPRERMFHGTKVPRERKCRGTKKARYRGILSREGLGLDQGQGQGYGLGLGLGLVLESWMVRALIKCAFGRRAAHLVKYAD